MKTPRTPQKHLCSLIVRHRAYTQGPKTGEPHHIKALREGRTLSQSSFCLVSGSARLSPLKVFSPISWYESPNDSWYACSWSAIRASTFFEDVSGEDAVTEAGSVIEALCFVSSCTCTTRDMSTSAS